MTISELVTHSGGFHADELLSSVVLTRLFPEARLIRTRDAALTAPAPGRLVYDVGRRYDLEAGIYDHHQNDAPLRADGAPYSSFGLIWRHYGAEFLATLGVPQDDIEAVHAAIDSAFVLPIDLSDNGAVGPGAAGPFAALTLPVMLETLKPPFDAREADADDRAFRAALDVARPLLEGAVAQAAGKRRAAQMVAEAIARAGSARVLELPMGMPFRAGVEAAGADHLLFVIHPRGDDWALTTIRTGSDTFENRADLPADWAGLSDSALEAASGVPGAVFCHKARFIAVARTRDAILSMAHKAVEAVETAG